jgi:4-aminobutyrate aminotransferase-like enzyme
MFFIKKSGKPTIDHTSLTMIIKMVNEDHMLDFEHQLNKGIKNPKVLKNFSAIKQENNCISITIHNIKDTDFSGPFLLAISETLKSMLLKDAYNQKDLFFHFEGEDAVDAAVCIASHGLWQADFSFVAQTELDLFKSRHEEIKEIIIKADPLIKQEIIKLANNSK